MVSHWSTGIPLSPPEKPPKGIDPEDLEAIVTAEPVERDFYETDIILLVGLWTENTGLMPGPVPGLTSDELIRHFFTFLTLNGYKLPTKVGHMFGRALVELGFVKGRARTDGRDRRPWLMDANSAYFFRGWLKQNPQPPKFQGPFGSNSARLLKGKQKTPKKETQ